MPQPTENAHRWAVAARIATRYELSLVIARQWVESCPDEQSIITLCEQVVREEHELTSRAFYQRLRARAERAAA